MRLVLIPALLLSAIAFGAEGEAPKAKPYTLDTCAATGEKLGEMGEPVVKEYKGQEIKFCCKGCVKRFEKDIDGNLEKVSKKMAERKEAPGATKADDAKATEALDRGM